MQILLAIHSLVRWVIIVVAVIAIIKYALGWLQKQQFGGMDRGLAAGFSGLMDLQALLGITYLVLDGLGGTGFPAYRIEHGITMIIAVAVAHQPARWKNLADELRYRNTLAAVVVSLVVVLIGITILLQAPPRG